ncbi:MAG: hypothetical protein H7Z14_19100 [Anaerolineae bacterium]|nr:hypothetical protein [Phycisphaerae bacterium]
MKHAPGAVSRSAPPDHFFDVHRGLLPNDNGAVAGRSSIVQRTAGVGGGSAGIAVIVATIVGALAFAHLVRTIMMRRGPGSTQSSRLDALRRAILGVQKKQIAAVLGQPRATIGRGNHLTDDTWYYPIDPKQRLALTIEFDRDIARQTQVIDGIRTARSRRQQIPRSL